MKGLMKKILASIILGLMMINSSFLTIISTAIEFVDTSKINTIAEIDLQKYVNYNLDENRVGTMLSAIIKSGIEYQEEQGYTPLLGTVMYADFPKIENEFPERVEVIGITTKATNGDDNAKDFQYSYDKETGKLIIITKNNQDDEGNIYSECVENARDEFEIIGYYSKNCYSEQGIEKDLEIKATVKEVLNNEEKTIVTKEISQSYKVSENISGLISTKVDTNEVYNGFINSNNLNNTKYTTQYEENVNLQISYTNISDEIKTVATKKLMNINDEEILTNEFIYKSTKINKQHVLEYLGENGFLQILNDKEELIKEINKDTETLEDGSIEINYENDISSLIIKTSSPIKLGSLNWKNVIEIKDSMVNLENNKIKTDYEIACTNIEEEIDEETKEVVKQENIEIYNYTENNIINIKDSETRIDLSVDKSEWTNSVQNDVVFTATLVTNDSKYNLFKNPVIDIKLPSEVEKVILGDVSILYGNGLNMKSANVLDLDGSKVIRVELDGVQSEYMINQIIDGANVLIPATIIINKNIESVNTTLNFSYSNQVGVQNDYEKESQDSKIINVNIQSIQNEEYDGIASYSMYNQALATINTEEEADLSVEVKAEVGNEALEENDVVYEREIITYTINITNNSNIEAKNIKATANIAEGTTYVIKDGQRQSQSGNTQEEGADRNELYIEDKTKEQVDIQVDSLSGGKTYTYTYKVIVDDLQNNSNKNIENNITVNYDEDEIYNQTMSFNAKEAKLNVEVYPAEIEYGEGDYYWVYDIFVKNISEENISNVVFETKISDEYEYDYTMGIENVNYNDDSRLLVMNLGELQVNQEKNILVRVKAKNFEDGKYEYDIPFVAKVYGDNTDIYRSDVDLTKAYSAGINVIQESEKEGLDLKGGEEIEYKFTITNSGKKGTLIEFVNNLPEGIRPISAVYEKFELQNDYVTYKKVTNTQDLTRKVIVDGEEPFDFKLETYIPEGESIIITIKGEANYLEETIDTVNIGTVFGEEITTKVSNAIKNRVLKFGYEEPDEPENPDTPDNPDNPDNPDTPDNPDEPENPDTPENPENPDTPDNPNIPENPDDKKYSISGNVWIDANRDGEIDSSEKNIEDITVKLFNSDTNSIVTDENGNKKIIKTDENGKYELSDLPVGNYIVLFEYDNNNYKLTTYKAKGISEELNSDVIQKEVSIDGVKKIVAVTDVINIESNNIEYINAGLVENLIFDMSLEKYISKVTVKNDSGEKEYTYDNVKLAKVDIPAKQVANTEIFIEYKFILKNEGNTDAYINEITDYLPDTLIFNSEDNNNWTKLKNGNLANTSLTGTIIKPGESKELTLVLAKQKSTEYTGNIENKAEITEVFNVDSLKQDNSENDLSKAEIIISVKTGIVKNIILVLIVLMAIAIILYIVKNRKINNVIKMGLFLILFGIIGTNIVKADCDSNTTALSGIAEFNWYDLGYHLDRSKNEWEPTTNADDGANLWCFNPGWSLCDRHDAVHKYYQSMENVYSFEHIVTAHIGGNKFEEVFKNSMGVTDVNSLFANTNRGTFSASQTPAPKTKLNSKWRGDKILVGPFRIDASVTGNSTLSGIQDFKVTGTSSYTICDAGGTEINPEIGKDLYLLVNKGTTWVNISANISASLAYEKNYVELYKYTFIGCKNGGKGELDKHSPKCQANGDKVQNLYRFKSKNKKETDNEVFYASWFTEVDPPKGSVKIVKVDKYDTNKKLAGAKFNISGAYYNQEHTTDGNGTITVNNLIPGDYTITEITPPSGYYVDSECNYYDSTAKTAKTTVKVVADTVVTRTFTNKPLRKIIINKRNLYSNAPVSGAVFRLYDSSWNRVSNIQVTTDSSGQATITGLKEGKYKLVEYKVPDGYSVDKNCLQTNQYIYTSEGEFKGKVVEDITIGKADHKTTFKNKHLLKLTLRKLDKHSGEPIEGVGFIIYCEEGDGKGGFVISYNANAKVDEGESVFEYAGGIEENPLDSNATDAKIFYTNSSGEIVLKNIPEGKYRVFEVKMDSNKAAGKYYDIKNKPIFKGEIDGGSYVESSTEDGRISCKYDYGEGLKDIYGYEFKFSGNASLGVESANEVKLILYNPQEYLDVSGYVWEDIGETKGVTRNNKYVEGSGDLKVSDIKVRLKDRNKKSVVDTTTTGSDGSYIFTKVPIVNVSNYYIEFEYNGLKYTNVVAQLPGDEPIEEYMLAGDFDGDGVITMWDALKILKAALKLISTTDEQNKRGDTDWDGYVTLADAQDALRIALNYEEIKGDINYDGKVNEEDTSIIEYYIDKGIHILNADFNYGYTPELGDVNGDARINEKDKTLIQRFALKMEIYTEDEKDRADIDENGKVELDDVKAFERMFPNEVIKTVKIVVDNEDLTILNNHLTKMKKTTSKKQELENTSKAAEKLKDREDFNSSYTYIEGDKSRTTSGTVGKSLTSTRVKSNTLNYTNGEHISLLVQNTGYSPPKETEEEENITYSVEPSKGITMTASTDEAKYNDGTSYKLEWKPGIRVIKHVNLGIIEREQPDIAIASDITAIQLSINGKSHTYPYGQKENECGLQFNINGKYQGAVSNYERTYIREVYKSYLNATKLTSGYIVESSKKTLDVVFKYKVVIKSQCTSLYTKVNKIAIHSDKLVNYTIDSSKIGETEVVLNTSGAFDDTNKKYMLSFTDGIYLEPNQECEIQMSVKLATDEVIKLADLDEMKIKITSEIASYSTYEKVIENGKEYYEIYAGIDKDSAPDNIVFGNTSTYEDDTEGDAVKLNVIPDVYEISGTVFEDSDNNSSDNERLGDGKFNMIENRISGVTVSLIEVKNINGEVRDILAQTYGNQIKNAQLNTSNYGVYSFKNLIPGDYKLKFTYGDGTEKIYSMEGYKVRDSVTTQDYKSTKIIGNLKEQMQKVDKGEIIEVPRNFYKDLEGGQSVAVDVWSERQKINSYSSSINYETVGYYNPAYKYIKAYTPIMDLQFEPIDGYKNLTKLNFGIIERPRQILNVTKEISNIKLNLQNGNSLVNGDPRNSIMNYTTYLPGLLRRYPSLVKIEMDRELIHGATLDLTYDIKIINNSEYDYDSESYYKYGDKGSLSPMKTTIKSIVDYLDGDLAINDSNWKKKLISELYNDSSKAISYDSYNSVKDLDNIYVYGSSIDLEPNGGESTIILNTSKKLTSSDETDYKNHVEILEAYNTAGRFYGNEEGTEKYVPGNHVIGDTNDEETDYHHVNMVITPNTGQERIYYILGFSCLTIVLAGVVLIKKKVLK